MASPSGSRRALQQRLAEVVEEQLAAAEAVPDPLTRAVLLGDVVAALEHQVRHVGQRRAAALERALGDGVLSQRYVAQTLGLSRQRVGQLAARARADRPPS